MIRRKKNGRERRGHEGEVSLGSFDGGWGWDAKSLDAVDVTNEMGCLVSRCEKWIHIAGCSAVLTFLVCLGGFRV